MKQQPTITNLPEQKKDENDRDYYDRVRAWLHGEDIRVKADLRNWKSCDFHLDRYPRDVAAAAAIERLERRK